MIGAFFMVLGILVFVCSLLLDMGEEDYLLECAGMFGGGTALFIGGM